MKRKKNCFGPPLVVCFIYIIIYSVQRVARVTFKPKHQNS